MKSLLLSIRELRARRREWLDWKIYCWSYPAITRYLKRSNGMSYLTYLQAKAYSEQNPPTQEVREATDTFFESMEQVKP